MQRLMPGAVLHFYIHIDIKAQLIRGAVRSEYMVYPNPVAGYGKLNIYTTFNMMRIS